MRRAVTGRFLLSRAALGLVLATTLVIVTCVAGSQAAATPPKSAAPKPTIVLVNGAWANTASNVKALVYVDAFAPAKGESALGLDATMPGSALGAGPAKVFNFVPYPDAPKGDALLYVKPAVFEQAFANGVPAREGAVLAATQAPAVYSALTAPSGAPAWKTIPSWYVLGTIDHAIPPAIQLFMAKRMHAQITRVHAGHLSMSADPGVVSQVIAEAARARG